MTVNPPISGANKGPVKTATQKPTMPIVHISGLSISRQTAPESVNEQAPKNPAKKRHMKIACRSFDTAVTKENTLNPNMLRVKRGLGGPSIRRKAPKQEDQLRIQGCTATLRASQPLEILHISLILWESSLRRYCLSTNQP